MIGSCRVIMGGGVLQGSCRDTVGSLWGCWVVIG